MKWRIRCIFFTWQGFWFTRCSSILVLARAQLCPTLCDPMDCNPPGSSVHGILRARILEWVAISFSRDLPDPGIKSMSLLSPALVGRFFTTSTMQSLVVHLMLHVFISTLNKYVMCVYDVLGTLLSSRDIRIQQ